MLGRRGQLQFITKLVFKAGDEYRKDQAVFRLWADARVQGQDGVPWNLGRAVIPEPVFFRPPSADSFASVHHDPWSRAIDRLTLDIDHRQLGEVEEKRRGGALTFSFHVGGTVRHGGRVGLLQPTNNQLTYDVSQSDWIRFLGQLSYGTYVTIEVPLTTSDGISGAAQKAARALGRRKPLSCAATTRRRSPIAGRGSKPSRMPTRASTVSSHGIRRPASKSACGGYSDHC